VNSYRGLSLRDFAYIVAIAEELNFHKAAERCYVTQPTLSIQVRKCERYLGLDIFNRDKHRVSITPIGTQVISHARLALEAADAIKRLTSQRRPFGVRDAG
jgi:LysR family hydrogen peroxide-inducible transcriptional activator